MRTISIVSQKGGCGRTTTAVNLAAALAQMGKRILLIDLDPQAHATTGLGRNPDSFERTIRDALMIPANGLDGLIVPTGVARLDLVPSNMLLAGAGVRLANASGGQTMLARCLPSVDEAYEFCVIDCPPSLGALTVNALTAGTDVIIPVQTDYYVVDGIVQLLETIGAVRDRAHPSIAENIRILLTFADGRTGVSRHVQRQVRHTFAGHVFGTAIHRNVKLAEAPGAAVPILAYAPHSRGAADYMALADEILRGRLRRKPPSAQGRRRGIPRRLAPILAELWGPERRARRPHRLDAVETT